MSQFNTATTRNITKMKYYVVRFIITNTFQINNAINYKKNYFVHEST